MSKALIADLGKCTGCEACVLACSLEKTGEFSPRAFIAVQREIQEGISIPLPVVVDGGDETQGTRKCDMCGGRPACVKVCGFGALRIVDWDKYSTRADSGAEAALVTLLAFGEV